MNMIGQVQLHRRNSRIGMVGSSDELITVLEMNREGLRNDVLSQQFSILIWVNY